MARTARWLPLFHFALLLAGCSASPSKEPIYLAHLLPLTGPDRELGRQAQQAVLLAVEEINQDEKGGIMGRPVHVRNVDTRGEADTAQGETVRLLSLQKTAAVLAPPDAAIAERVVRTSHPYQTAVILTTVIVPAELAEPPTGDGVVCLGVNPRKRGQILAQHAAQVLKAKRAIVLTDKRNPVGKSVATGFLDEWPRGVPASAEEWTSANLGAETDLAKRLTDAKADVVLVSGSVADFLKVRSQCEAAKVASPLLYGGEDAGVRPLQGNAVGPEVYLATVLAGDALADRGKAFAKKYEERFHEPPDLVAVQAYDAVRLVTDTMQRDNSTSDLGPSIYKTEKFESLTGPIAWKDRQAKRPLFLVRLHEKEATVVKTIKADE
jgi:branched-chain amino acid transport system substrate-binding protein